MCGVDNDRVGGRLTAQLVLGGANVDAVVFLRWLVNDQLADAVQVLDLHDTIVENNGQLVFRPRNDRTGIAAHLRIDNQIILRRVIHI